MKEYGIYDLKDNEQLVYMGNIKEIAKYLECSTNSLRSYLSLKRSNKRSGLLKKRYELLEIQKDNLEENEEETKTNKEKFEAIIKTFEINLHEIIRGFQRYNNQERKIFQRNYFQESDFDGEEWKEIKGLNYLVSNYGRIKNKTTKKLKQLKFQLYGMQVVLWQKSKGYTITISRLVAEMFIRHVEENERVSHINNNIRDNYYKNLKIVSK